MPATREPSTPPHNIPSSYPVASSPSRETRALKRKRAADDEDEHSEGWGSGRQELVGGGDNKRRRPCGDESANRQRRRLSKNNLRKLQSELDVMEPPPMPSRKRAASGQRSTSDLNDATSSRSQRSGGSLKFYRYDILARARLYVRPEYPPPEMQAQLHVIFDRHVPDWRRARISRIAKQTANTFSTKTRGAHREDDLVEALYSAFSQMFSDEKFNCPRKADWDGNLKPNIQQEDIWDMDTLDNLIDRPNKRQQADRSLPSPDTSQSTRQPKQDGAVKNPRPDFTFGYHHSTITASLTARGLTRLKADEWLRVLQREQRLFSDPTVDYLDVRFPIQTLEGKAYATGRPIFEAENQAAVSGACMVNLQQQLFDLYNGAFPNRQESKTPFAFSLCTEGPIVQFWLHYALVEESTRMHYMNLLHVCYASLHDTLEVLLVKWEQLMGWYGEVFLEEIADKLYALAKHAERS